MHIEFLPEPNLEFGSGMHIDTRFGLLNLGPLDQGLPTAPHVIKAGVCGTPKTVEGITSWIAKCKSEIPAKPSPRFNLFPRFPGFNHDGIFHSEIVIDSRDQRAIPERILNPALIRRDDPAGLDAIVAIFIEELTHIAQGSPVDVLICAPPPELDRGTASEIGREDADKTPKEDNLPTFHNLLKARGMTLRKPLQLIFPATYGAPVPRNRRGDRLLQDEATRAWNFHVALYYKAGGRPWRLVREPTDFATCFVGVSFYESANQTQLLTSMAQVFNERGHGVIVRGAAPKKSDEDRRPHLTQLDASNLLFSALTQYRSEHHTMPARVVIHKSSRFNKEEIAGFTGAMNDMGIESGDLINLDRSWTRLFRRGAYPPLRGSLLITDSGPHFLYTRGSIEFYSAYPGPYVPRPIEYEIDWGDDTPKQAGKEILELTKMNWNTTQFDNGEPITLHAARQVGSILKYAEEDAVIEPRYSYYM